MCVCVCARARARVCVCEYARVCVRVYDPPRSWLGFYDLAKSSESCAGQVSHWVGSVGTNAQAKTYLWGTALARAWIPVSVCVGVGGDGGGVGGA